MDMNRVLSCACYAYFTEFNPTGLNELNIIRSERLEPTCELMQDCMYVCVEDFILQRRLLTRVKVRVIQAALKTH